MTRGIRSWLWLAVVCVAIAALYVASPGIISSLIHRGLLAQGFEPIRVVVQPPGWQGLIIDELRFKGRLGPRSYTFASENIRLDYRIDELIGGTLRGIQVPRAELHITLPEPNNGAAESREAKQATILLASVLSGQWLRGLPVEALEAQEIISHIAVSSSASIETVLSARISQQRLSLAGQLTHEEYGDLELSATTAASGEIHCELRRKDADHGTVLRFVSVPELTSVSPLVYRGTFYSDLDLLTVVAKHQTDRSLVISEPVGTLQGKWQISLPSLTAGEFADVSLAVESEIVLSAKRFGSRLHDIKSNLTVDVSLQRGVVNWRLHDTSYVSARIGLHGSLQSDALLSGNRTFVAEKWRGRIKFEEKHWALLMAGGSVVKIKSGDHQMSSFQESRLQLMNEAKLQRSLHDNAWSTNSFELQVKTGALKWQQLGFSYDTFSVGIQQLEWRYGTWIGKGTLAISGLNGRIADTNLRVADVKGEFELENQTANLHADLKAAESALHLQANLKHDFTRRAGGGTVRLLPVTFDESKIILSKLTESWPHVFDIYGGTIEIHGNIHWQQPASARKGQKMVTTMALQIKGDGLRGSLYDLPFSGMDANLLLEDKAKLYTPKEAQLSIEKIDIGLPIKNLTTRFHLSDVANPPHIVIKVSDFRAELLGGHATGGPFEYHAKRETNKLDILLHDISLDEIMALERQPGLTGSGILDGHLPLEINRQGIQFTQGKLSARPPGGYIKYSPSESVRSTAEKTAGVNQLLQVLENFQYDVLEITTDYSINGDVVLLAKLEGKNPDWQSGQPIHLNINLQENIPMLLRSLRIADQLSEELTEGFQRQPAAEE